MSFSLLGFGLLVPLVQGFFVLGNVGKTYVFRALPRARVQRWTAALKIFIAFIFNDLENRAGKWQAAEQTPA